MRRWLILAAAGVVLVANLWGILQAARNRAEPCGGRLELTEGDLQIKPVSRESTVALLNLRWRVRHEGTNTLGPPAWLDHAKLAELGFDYRLAVDSPAAQRHYTSLAPRPAYLVLECEAERPGNDDGAAKERSRLVVIDAARNPAALRAKYPEAGRRIITRGIVAVGYRDRNHRGDKLPMPQVEGRIEAVLPSQVFVPRPYSQRLAELRRENPKPERAKSDAPRFTATVCWGASYEPWITDLRLIEPHR